MRMWRPRAQDIFPDLSLNWTYGIDAPQFATYGPLDPSLNPAAKPRNLGYSASATLDIPVWDWFATHDRVKQSQVKRSVAKLALTQAQKRLLADLDEYYNEAETAEKQMASLDQSVKDATESLRLTNLRYQAAEATALEVVDAAEHAGPEPSRPMPTAPSAIGWLWQICKR